MENRKEENKKPTYGMPDEAMKWYYEQRAYPQGFIPVDWRDKALSEIQQKNQLSKGALALNWSQLDQATLVEESGQSLFIQRIQILSTLVL
ncbi:MAG: hypothetical protein MZV64_03355 [Ignavibacteriales bacterium]|nr:hypothetical protein [Ignavibacteriales bacterium]